MFNAVVEIASLIPHELKCIFINMNIKISLAKTFIFFPVGESECKFRRARGEAHAEDEETTGKGD